jgi:pyruvate/2-oxoglutarate dehydrogenase complex dihydrolipoamide acyltransferase (E2) component
MTHPAQTRTGRGPHRRLRGEAMSPTRPDTRARDTEPATAAAGYTLSPVPAERQPVLDRLAGASRRFQVHALVELDVTHATAQINDADPRVSWTGFLIASIARAVAQHPEVNARKAGNQILSFDRVDIGATVEQHWQGRRVLDIVVVTDADQKSCAEITELLHAAKYGPGQPHRPSGLTRQIVRLPGLLRRAAIRAAGTRPGIAATFGPAVGVTSIGMFSQGWGWAIPLAPLTVIVTAGGVAERAVVRDGQVVARPMLPLTLSFDHAVIDGAPAARFTETLRTLVESPAALEDAPTPPDDPRR